jgi:periplasmic divalent cation tolerance protein
MADAGKAYVVFITAPDAERATSIARVLVEEQLAACVNILGGVRSIYRWQGKVVDDGEVLCMAKTDAGHFEALKRRVVELHPYEVPEVIGLEIKDGHAPYLEWLTASLK